MYWVDYFTSLGRSKSKRRTFSTCEIWIVLWHRKHEHSSTRIRVCALAHSSTNMSTSTSTSTSTTRARHEHVHESTRAWRALHHSSTWVFEHQQSRTTSTWARAVEHVSTSTRARRILEHSSNQHSRTRARARAREHSRMSTSTPAWTRINSVAGIQCEAPAEFWTTCTSRRTFC